ncbi:MAG: oxygen-dependent coproporphyrinogen oxidase [Cyclobacteriaceae bacterium]|nr:oxygen-dependent coproporphyrinogen oxidase [Cyclobacteriaceae bacterium]
MEKESISAWFKKLQEELCENLEQLDGSGKFRRDPWPRKGGGGGITRVLEEGNIIEKGGVNFSEVFGKTNSSLVNDLNTSESDFYATGISVVLHPISPMIPIIHMNTRYFEMGSGESWFGGGIDLTPHYVLPEDAVYFHKALKNVCDKFDPDFYPAFKKEADDYFFIRHRNETRGIGGIFFDRLSDPDDKKMKELFEFTKAVGSFFFPVYRDLVSRNKTRPYGNRERQWQGLRRGRYVEFNLVWDKGTKFGLETEGRTESILMSLPNSACWIYDHQTDPHSNEHNTLKWLKKGVDWINLK